jgi:hypothetical protein
MKSCTIAVDDLFNRIRSHGHRAADWQEWPAEEKSLEQEKSLEP